MTWQTYQDLTAQQSFEIVGQWGFRPDALVASGTLHYQATEMQLLLTSGDLALAQHAHDYLYGQGTVIVASPNGAPNYLPVKVSLSGLYLQRHQQTLQGTQTQVVMSYGVLGMALGAYVQAETTLTALQLDLSNFTAWLQPAVGTVKRTEHDPDLTPADLFHFTVADRTYQLLTTTTALTDTLINDHQIAGFQTHQSLGITLPAGGCRLAEVGLMIKQVADWFAVVSGQPEAVVRTIAQLADGDQLNLFEVDPTRQFQERDYRFTRLAMPRTDAWLTAMATSLANWILTYDKLLPLVTTLNPTRPVIDINHEIQSICNCLNVVFDQFYKTPGRKKEVYYRHKVKIVLDNCDHQYVQRAMGALTVVRSTNQLLDLIRDARNVSAHSSLAITTVKGLTTVSQKYQFQLVLKTLLRLWLLHQLGLSQQLLAAEVRLAQPFEVAMTSTWM